MVERSLSMREVEGSMPSISTFFPFILFDIDLSQKESIKERQNIEEKRTKTKSLEAQTSVTKRKKDCERI